MNSRAIIPLAMAGVALTLCSCGTPYRYEYYDYKGKTVDERNKERERQINQQFMGVVPQSGSGAKRLIR